MDFIDAAKRVFIYDEGCRFTQYNDSKGYPTIGIGHLLKGPADKVVLNIEIIEIVFASDLAIAVREARLVVGGIFYDSLTMARQLALVSMLFTLGRTKFLKFEKTIAAMKAEDWDEVANQILQSKWASDVDPRRRQGFGRDDRIAHMFAAGTFHSDYQIEE